MSPADSYTLYEHGLARLAAPLDAACPVYADILLQAHRLRENIDLVRRYGDHEQRRAERYVIIDQLNRLSLAVLNISFLELCQLPRHSPSVADRFIAALGAALCSEPNVLDLSRNSEFADFGMIGLRENDLGIDLFAFVSADQLTETQIVQLRDQCLLLTRTLPSKFGLRLGGRNPNGVLGFVFAQPCPDQTVRFIKKQSRAEHWGDSGVIVSWTIDLAAQRVHSHDNPVAWLPPLVIVPQLAFPSSSFLEAFMCRYRDSGGVE